jgi:hypothetical protein
MDESKEFEVYMSHLAQGLGHADRHAGLTSYCTGLMLPLARKSVEPMVARVDPLPNISRCITLWLKPSEAMSNCCVWWPSGSFPTWT